MSMPLRKGEFDEELSTADLAQGKRPVVSDDLRRDDLSKDDVHNGSLHKPVPAEPVAGDLAEDRDVAVEEVTEPAASHGSSSANTSPLFPAGELDGLRTRWNDVQGAFVDEPRRAVEEADGLVASAMKRLAEVFAEERSKLEQQWDRGDNVSTEDLRIALQRYRSFFHRLLSV